MKKFLAVIFFCLIPVFLFSVDELVSVDIDAGKVINTFKPYNIFGNNVNGWSNPEPVKEKIEAAGNFILRYPGGSWGDAFFWNSSGSFDNKGNWVPSLEEFGGSTLGDLLHDSKKALDKDPSTYWLSNTDTDFPGRQWIYIDLKEKKMPDKVVITWGDAAGNSLPYASVFSVQFWDKSEGRQWMPYGADKNAWINTSAAEMSSKGGKQEVSFQPVETQYLRILMQRSSAGKRGPYSVAEIKIYSKGEDITPADPSAAVASTTDTAVKLNDGGWIWHFEKYMDFMRSFEKIKAEPLIIVNVGSGTAEMAAAWVKYANKIKGYGIKYWEVGNENGGQWETGGPLDVYDYTRRYIKYYEAMKAVDPSITILAQAQFDNNSQTYDGVSHVSAFLKRLAKEKKVKYAEGLVSHHYPNWGQKLEDFLNSPAADMQKAYNNITEALKPYPQLKDIPVWFTEFNTSDHVMPHDVSVHLENGLWLAQYMPEFIRHFGSRGYMNLWDVMNGGSAINEEFGGDHGYLQAEQGPYQYQERADYWVMQMMTNYWSTPGDQNDHKFLETLSSEKMLAVFGNLKPDGTLALLAVNKSPETEYKAKLKIKSFVASDKAVAWRFNKDNYHWKTDSKPYHADPSKPASRSEISAKENGFEYTFPPYSVTVIEFSPAVKQEK